MDKPLFFELFVLTVLVVSVSAIPCKEEPIDSPGCTICSKWEQVNAGDFICADWPRDKENIDRNACEETGVMEKVCVEEEVFKPEHRQCARFYQSKGDDTCETVARKADIAIRHLQELNDGNICDSLPSSKSIRICVSGSNDRPEAVE